MKIISDEFPIFRHFGTVLDYQDLQYNPCNDIIFPSVIEAYKYLRAPLGKYYMYYAPHNAPGGICLSYADSLTGPWHEHPANPLITKDWPPYYTVSHVSSPHILWVPESDKFFMFFHGNNLFTRFAVTEDGINFSYGDEAVTDQDFDCRTGAFYARVFPFTIAGKDNCYVMLLMCQTQDGGAIYLAYSRDCRKWKTRREPLITPEPGTGLKYICSPWLWHHNGRHYILYHGDIGDMKDLVTDIYATEIDESFEKTRFAGRLYQRQAVSPDNRRVSDPCLIVEDNKIYLFTSTGTRLNQKISLAIAENR